MMLENFKILSDDDVLQNKEALQKLKEKNHCVYIVYGGVGCGKTSVIEYVVKNCDVLEFNASSKKSLKYIKDEVEKFTNFVTFEKEKIIFFDEFEVFIEEGVGAGSIIDILKTTKMPVYIVVNEIHLNKMRKICTRGNFEYINMEFPSKEVVINFFHKLAKSNKLKITKAIIKSNVVGYYPDMRRISHALNGMTLGKSDIFTNDYVETFNLIRSNVSLSQKLVVAESDLFTQLAVFHENYPKMINKSNIDIVSDTVSSGDIVHTYAYTNQEWDLMYVSILCGIIYPSQFLNNKKKPTYASIISKISNFKTKQKNTKELIKNKELESTEQLKCLWLLGKLPSKEEAKLKVLYSLD